jgi:hypothetical protein
MKKSLTTLALLMLFAGPAFAQSHNIDPAASNINTTSNYAPGQKPQAEDETLDEKAMSSDLNTTSNYAPGQIPQQENEALDERAIRSNLNTN